MSFYGKIIKKITILRQQQQQKKEIKWNKIKTIGDFLKYKLKKFFNLRKKLKKKTFLKKQNTKKNQTKNFTIFIKWK